MTTAAPWWESTGRSRDPFGIPGVPMLPPPSRSTAVPLKLPKDVIRVGDGAIWSTVKIEQGAVANRVFRLFASPLGTAGQGYTQLSIAETNIREGGRVPNGLAFDIDDIACIVKSGGASGITLGEVQCVYAHACLSWSFLSTQIDIAPVALVGAGGGIFGIGAGNPAANDAPALNNGSGNTWVYRRHPIMLAGSSTFNILLRFGGEAPNIGIGTAIQVVLMGGYRQAIEVG
jgi:hypothetical protein